MPRLTAKQSLFIEHYLSNGLNGTDAARQAGYSEKSCRVIATENLTKPAIVDEIKKRIGEQLANIEELHFLWLQECRRLAFSTPEPGLSYAVDMAAKASALQLLGRYLHYARIKDGVGDIVLEISGEDAALL